MRGSESLVLSWFSFLVHSSFDERLADWFGLDQSKYQWALNDYYENNGKVSALFLWSTGSWVLLLFLLLLLLQVDDSLLFFFIHLV